MYRYYKIAGLNIKMDTFGRTEDYAIPYLLDGKCSSVDMTIKADFKALKAEKPFAPDDICEYMVSGREFYSKLLDFEGMMLHAAAIALDQKAYLFSGNCEVGKSTHALLWRRAFGDERIRILNDDKPAIRLENGTWYAYGTPWSGKNGLNTNLKYPLAGICYLKQGNKNQIEICNKPDLVDRFLQNTYRPTVLDKKIKLLTTIEKIIKTVPIWEMEATKEIEAAKIAYRAMSGR